MAIRTYIAYVEYDPEMKLYVGIVPSLPGAHSQGATRDELHHKLEEVVARCLEEMAERGGPTKEDRFVEIQKIAVGL